MLYLNYDVECQAPPEGNALQHEQSSTLIQVTLTQLIIIFVLSLKYAISA